MGLFERKHIPVLCELFKGGGPGHLCVCAFMCTRMHLCLYVGASVKLFKMERSSDHSCSSEMDFQFFHGKDGGW